MQHMKEQGEGWGGGYDEMRGCNTIPDNSYEISCHVFCQSFSIIFIQANHYVKELIPCQSLSLARNIG